jgi:hypothetical protein
MKTNVIIGILMGVSALLLVALSVAFVFRHDIAGVMLGIVMSVFFGYFSYMAISFKDECER